MRQTILAGPLCAADGRKRSGFDSQRAADIFQSQGVGHLCIDQTDEMTPRFEGAALVFQAVLAGKSRPQMVANQIAQLSQESKPAAR